MIENKAYIKINNKKEKTILEELLNETFDEINITWNDTIGYLSTFNCEAFQSKLIKLVSFATLDGWLQTSIIIVPFFDDLFIKYFDIFSNQVCTAFELFARNVNGDLVKKDVKEIIDKIEKKDMDTLKAFLSCNGNAMAASNELFLHRNSFNYRMNQFMDNNNIDIRDLNTLMFFNLILSLNA